MDGRWIGTAALLAVCLSLCCALPEAQEGGSREAIAEDSEGVRNFEKRSRWASQKFSEMEFETPSRMPQSPLLNKFRKPAWMTEEDEEKFREEQWERYCDTMERGSHHNVPVGHERVSEEIARRRPVEHKALPVQYFWADTLLWGAAGFLVLSALALTRIKPSGRRKGGQQGRAWNESEN